MAAPPLRDSDSVVFWVGFNNLEFQDVSLEREPDLMRVLKTQTQGDA